MKGCAAIARCMALHTPPARLLVPYTGGLGCLACVGSGGGSVANKQLGKASKRYPAVCGLVGFNGHVLCGFLAFLCVCVRVFLCGFSVAERLEKGAASVKGMGTKD